MTCFLIYHYRLLLFIGVCINKAFLMLRHMGVVNMTARNYFKHQQTFLIPSILLQWEKYQNRMLTEISDLASTVWSGDGRYDSMGHNAKYGTYTFYCNTNFKIAHFELLQVSLQIIL